MENSIKWEIAVLDGRTIRKFINRMNKLGADIKIDRPNHKAIYSAQGVKIFSALKYKSGWDCRIVNLFVNDLKSCF
jgi:hypothetical protein